MYMCGNVLWSFHPLRWENPTSYRLKAYLCRVGHGRRFRPPKYERRERRRVYKSKRRTCSFSRPHYICICICMYVHTYNTDLLYYIILPSLIFFFFYHAHFSFSSLDSLCIFFFLDTRGNCVEYVLYIANIYMYIYMDILTYVCETYVQL